MDSYKTLERLAMGGAVLYLSYWISMFLRVCKAPSMHSSLEQERHVLLNRHYEAAPEEVGWPRKDEVEEYVNNGRLN